MAGPKRGSGTRSNLYSASKLTNWSENDPHWLEVSALPTKLRAAAFVDREGEDPLPIFERPLADGFVRPFSIGDAQRVLSDVPTDFLTGLSGVYLLGGTSKQRRLKNLRYGMYSLGQVFLCPFPESMMNSVWDRSFKPSDQREYAKFGVQFTPHLGGGVTVTFDDSSLRSFYLYDVLLHEIGRHIDDGRSGTAERFAHWFADYEAAQLLKE